MSGQWHQLAQEILLVTVLQKIKEDFLSQFIADELHSVSGDSRTLCIKELL